VKAQDEVLGNRKVQPEFPEGRHNTGIAKRRLQPPEICSLTSHLGCRPYGSQGPFAICTQDFVLGFHIASLRDFACTPQLRGFAACVPAPPPPPPFFLQNTSFKGLNSAFCRFSQFCTQYVVFRKFEVPTSCLLLFSNYPFLRRSAHCHRRHLQPIEQ